ncbi:hypothetical protein [Pseudomonas turukhanskensis]|uniref:hypothetical protein n=1 Tax=Pseudomonas turukhanskensis TaxID=1806536 RepID=UPI0022F30FAC|nr:hypothetical protein [Pseudomonas turukhanskensis]
MPFFPPITLNGETYDLSHLDPMTLNIDSAMAAKVLTVGVRFSNHCFTKAYNAQDHPAGPILLDAGGRQRSFCQKRYTLSLQLGQLLSELNHPKIQVWQTVERRNWVYSTTVEGHQGPYHVFFEIKRNDRKNRRREDLNMVIESAYPEGDLRGGPSRFGRMGFLLLCGKIYTRKPTATKR